MRAVRCILPSPRRGGRLASAASPFLLAALLASCSKEPVRPRSAILVTLDTMRADVLGCYGGAGNLTPCLDELARSSVRYHRARSVASMTLPSHASILTGLYPLRHGVRDNGVAPLSASARTLAELARERGLQTAAFVASSVLDRAFALDQGFDVYGEPERGTPALDATAMARQARWWLGRRDRSRPFLLWLHLYDPHVPYAPPASYLERASDAYRGEVAYVDATLGELISELEADGTLASTLLVVVGDHGESLGQHGEPTHGALCYDSTLRVPFLVRHPDGWRAGESSQETVSVVDVFPTLVEALELGEPGDIDGLSLYRRMVPPERGVYFESYSGWLNYGWSPLAGWADQRLKYLHSSSPELYDPAADPQEKHDLLGRLPGEPERYRAAIAALAARPALPLEDSRLQADVLGALRQLGYAASGAVIPDLPGPLEETHLPSPRERAVELAPLTLASHLAEQGRWEDAIPLLEEILAENPRNRMALDFLGYDLLQVGRHAEAREVLERRLALEPERSDTHVNLGLALELLGDDAAALESMDRALAIDAACQPALEAAARIAARAEETERAEGYRERLQALAR